MAQGEGLGPGGAPAPLPADFLDCTRDAVLVYRLDGTVRGYNLRLAELFKSSSDLAEQLAVRPGGPHPIPPLAASWPSLLSGELRVVPFCLTAAPGPAIELELFGRRIARLDGDVIFIELRDITAVNRAERALHDSKRQLESAVLVRTRALQQKIALIEQQQRELLALSTPVIQVWDGVLVLPLIGTIDRSRSEQLIENLLESITHTRSRQVIIDITGVPSVEEAGAAAILRAIRAARLLGAECSLAGISPAVARSLVKMETGWSGDLRTFGNLQAALLAAISHSLRIKQ